MGILKKRRDSFLPTYPFYNIKREKATQPPTTNLVLEFYKSSSLSFGLSVFLSFSLSLFWKKCYLDSSQPESGRYFYKSSSLSFGNWKPWACNTNLSLFTPPAPHEKCVHPSRSSPPPTRPPPLNLEKVLLRLVPAWVRQVRVGSNTFLELKMCT